MIQNPILPGFNPDPSICRVGEDYYIATSTFEWYPGVQIHHSRDLVNWKLVRRPLERASQLDMRGNPDSCGVWAPCLSYADGLFWLVYTDVKRLDGNFKDAHNYIVTSPAIEGDWSEPCYINSSGFDPSLFHDDNGRKWFVNMVWNHRSDSVGGNPKHPAFAGILLQELDPMSRKCFGPIENITPGSPHGLTEAPHLFKRNGWYYLTVAEGGTGYQHAVTMMRSRSLRGPYELHPNTHVLTSKDAPNAVLQRSGHGQIVETPDGQTYHTHLCSRPVPDTKRSPLGRETAIQKCVWRDDDWLYLQNGGVVPSVEVEPPQSVENSIDNTSAVTIFDTDTLPIEFQWLRTPKPERLFELTGKALRLTGRESVGSWFEQTIVARRQEHFKLRIETNVSFDPENFQQLAGLTHYYNRHKFHLVGITWHEEMGRSLTILSCPGDWPENQLSFPMDTDIPLPDTGSIDLAMNIDGASLQFQYRTTNQEQWVDVGPMLDASVISDEGGRGEHASFTGAFVGMIAFDTSGAARQADFHHFHYLGLD
ncbi:MAG: glycoside hydrolase family 43 protein [Pseudomonadota bacterium]